MTVTVSQATLTLVSIAVTGASSSMVVGANEQLTAQAGYSDNSTANINSQATWNSSDSTIATVSSSGLVTGVKPGSVTITAIVGTVSGTMTISVNPPTPTLSSITIVPSSFSIASGQVKQLSAQGVYSNGSIQDVTAQATWTSNNSNYVSVSAYGVAMGASAGSATITATIGSMSGTTLATTTAVTLSSITVTPASAAVAIGQTQAFSASGIYSDGSSTDLTNSVIWSSGNTSLVTINRLGIATGVANSNGSPVTITATSAAVTGPASLSVTAATLVSIDITPDDQSVPRGAQYPLMLTGSYSDNTTQTITNATWSSSNPTLASVDSITGNVTGLASSNGSPVTITASAGGMTNTTSVYVTSAVIKSLTLTPATASIARGTSQQFGVNAIFSDGTIQPLSDGLSWSSSVPSTAGIDASGLATGISQGQTVISVSYASLTASAALVVTSATPTSIVVTPSLPGIGINGNVLFTATGVFTDGSTQDLTAQVAWSSSDANIALISAAGLATGLRSGTSTISAAYQGLSGSTILKVSTATLVSISITPANPVVPPHARIQLAAIGTFSDSTTAVLSGVQWYTNTGRYASVSSSGVVRTKKATNHAVPVYAKLNGIIGQTTLTISSMSIASLQITPSNQTMAVGTTLVFSLIGTFSDGVTKVDLTRSAQWQTSNYLDAVIDRSGVVTGVSSGSVTISGIYGGLTPATTPLSVSNATLQSIAVTPSSPIIVLGSTQTFTAAGTFSDGSTQDITSVSQWTSSNPPVAVVNQNGQASSASKGQTDITATFKGISNFALLSVN